MPRRHLLPRRAFVGGAVAALAGCAGSEVASAVKPPAAAAPPRRAEHEITDYRLEMALDVPGQSFQAELEVVVAVGGRGGPLVLDAKELELGSFTAEGRAAPHRVERDTVIVELPSGVERTTLRTRYRGRASKGLQFHRDQVYTAFDTPRWMPCQMDPGRRASFTARLEVPSGYRSMGSGVRAGRPEEHRWSLVDRYPAYVLGFAAGDYWDASAKAGAVELELLASKGVPREVGRALGEVQSMLAFFEKASGRAYPGSRFGIVFARGSVAQEYVHFAALRESYAWEWLAEPREDWLFAHELAHAWWGNLVTCASWPEFWLNEAFATFMTALWKESRWGRPEYDREMALARRRVDKLARDGKARPLRLPAGTAVGDVGGAWPYVRGLVALDAIRERLGDAGLTAGVQRFVRERAGRGATTADLVTALAEDAGTRGAIERIIAAVPAARPRTSGLPTLPAQLRSGPEDGAWFDALADLRDRCSGTTARPACAAELATAQTMSGHPSRLVSATARRVARSERMAFWSQLRRGTNFFNRVESVERFHAAAAAGIRFVRLAPNKWQGTGRDFLLGDADHYRGPMAEDLALLGRALDHAAAAGVRVLLTTLSLPGARWKQHHGDTNDLRLWADDAFHAQAAAFWADLAQAVGGHPAIVGYDLLNEPRPEAAAKIFDAGDVRRPPWVRTAIDGPADVNRFYRRVVAAIRAVDPVTPIVVESSLDAAPSALVDLEPLDDENTLYSFHMYEPWAYTSHTNKGRFRYPGPVAGSPAPGGGEAWDAAAVRSVMDPVTAWCSRHRLAPERIIAAELGCFRGNMGAAQWLEDVVADLEQRRFHWAFYSFREDEWAGMDYEKGPQGEARRDNPLWSVLGRRLRRGG